MLLQLCLWECYFVFTFFLWEKLNGNYLFKCSKNLQSVSVALPLERNTKKGNKIIKIRWCAINLIYIFNNKKLFINALPCSRRMLSFRLTFRSPFFKIPMTMSQDRPGCACSAFVSAARSVCDATTSRLSNYVNQS